MDIFYIEKLDIIADSIISISKYNLESAEKIFYDGFPRSMEEASEFINKCFSISSGEDLLYELKDVWNNNYSKNRLNYEYDEDIENLSFEYYDKIHFLILRNIVLKMKFEKFLAAYTEDFIMGNGDRKFFYRGILEIIDNTYGMNEDINNLKELKDRIENEFEKRENYEEKNENLLINNEQYIGLLSAIDELTSTCEEYSSYKSLKRYFMCLQSALIDFGNGEETEDFSFSIVENYLDNTYYIEFRLQEDTIEISKGGHVYDKEFGGDSYTDWMCTFWRDGDVSGNVDFNMDTFTGIIDVDTDIIIELPEKYALKCYLDKLQD